MVELERLLERSGLAELEVEQGETTVILRTPAAIAAPAVAAAPPVDMDVPAVSEPLPFDEPAEERGGHAVTAPLTGVFYRSPSPDAALPRKASRRWMR